MVQIRFKVSFVVALSAVIVSCQTAQKTTEPTPTQSLAERVRLALDTQKVVTSVILGGASCNEIAKPSIEIPATKNSEKIYCNETFCSQYSERAKNPYWVTIATDKERMTSKAVARKDEFHSDVCPPTASPKPFKGTQIDLGHMLPAEDVRYSKASMYQSGSMLNVAAQPRTFNRGVWAQIEKIVRTKEKEAKRSWIITGPVKPYSTEKLQEISIPQRYFKVVLSESENGVLSAYAFIANVGVKGPATSFRVSVDKVEEETGYDFFGDLPDEIEYAIEALGA